MTRSGLLKKIGIGVAAYAEPPHKESLGFFRKSWSRGTK
jgi:hypothetical protein